MRCGAGRWPSADYIRLDDPKVWVVSASLLEYVELSQKLARAVKLPKDRDLVDCVASKESRCDGGASDYTAKWFLCVYGGLRQPAVKAVLLLLVLHKAVQHHNAGNHAASSRTRNSNLLNVEEEVVVAP